MILTTFFEGTGRGVISNNNTEIELIGVGGGCYTFEIKTESTKLVLSLTKKEFEKMNSLLKGKQCS